MKTFMLPDLGEGLPEAEIVTWHVKEGDKIKVDEPLLSVETAKAVVEVPSPFTGIVVKLHAAEGGIVETGKPLADFQVEGDSETLPEEAVEEKNSGDSATVVGNMPTSDEVVVETAVAGGKRKRAQGRVKAAPATRALAKKMGLDLALGTASGKFGQVTADDVRQAPQQAPAGGRPTAPSAPLVLGKPEPLRGPRRAMAQSMSMARDQVSPCTIFDDADIHRWLRKNDITVRVLRAIAAGCGAEPGLNAFYDGESKSREMHQRVDIAMAVDTPDGLIVPVVRDVAGKDAVQLRADINRIKKATHERTVAPADMRDYTITLSNFGMMAGRYATPVVVPPTVAILGTGGIRHDVIAVMGGVEVHRRIPLSLTFDHRCVTGGEACRFLAAVIADLAAEE
ncbi:MAG: dihydrolipoamide acetyltransferase family protein [Alphaproteobacteria bacterium]|nr:dihydrolipoamide acetyltransferase family protein [Alphaproteobacteria bacterium]